MNEYNNEPRFAPRSSEDVIGRIRADQERRRTRQHRTMRGMVIAVLVLLALTVIFVSRTAVLSGKLSALEEDISQLEAENARLSTEAQQLEEEANSYSVLLDPTS